MANILGNIRPLNVVDTGSSFCCFWMGSWHLGRFQLCMYFFFVTLEKLLLDLAFQLEFFLLYPLRCLKETFYGSMGNSLWQFQKKMHCSVSRGGKAYWYCFVVQNICHCFSLVKQIAIRKVFTCWLAVTIPLLQFSCSVGNLG
jgi:hypothetical protein